MRASEEVVARRVTGHALWLAVTLTACSGSATGNLFPDDARADAAASVDVTTGTDVAASVDAVVVPDADGGARDVTTGTDVSATTDAVATDVVATDVVATDVVATDVVASDVPAATDAGRVLHTAGFVTVHAGPQSVGTRRLLQSGFEGLVRSCVGTRCLTGGFLP